MTTEELLILTGIGRRELRAFDAALPIQSRSRERSRRLWTIGDSVSITIAADLVARGLEEEVALRLVAEAAPHFIPIVASEVQVFAVAVRDDTDPSGVRIVVGTDKGELLDAMLDRPRAAIVDITAAVRDALGRLLAAKSAERTA